MLLFRGTVGFLAFDRNNTYFTPPVQYHLSLNAAVKMTPKVSMRYAWIRQLLVGQPKPSSFVCLATCHVYFDRSREAAERSSKCIC